MADLGWPELSIIALAVVLLFGWKRMPDMARSLGRSARIFRSEVDQMRARPGAGDDRDATDTPDTTGATRGPAGSTAGPAPGSLSAADVRVAAADAEVARLRAELETRRHASGSH